MEWNGLLAAERTLIHERRRSARLQYRPLLCVLATILSYDAAQAQLFERALVFQGARLVTMAGEPIEKGSLIVKGGKIKQIGSKVDVPFLSKTFDLAGKTVTPGFIDSWSALGRLEGFSSADPTALARDAFDPYAKDAFRDALRNGLTTIYVGTGGSAGITGVGVVMRLVPRDGGAIGEIVSNDAALCINLDSGARVVSRLKTYRSVRKQFKKALKYRQSLEDYEEELKEYLEKLVERREKKSEGDEKEDANGGESGEDGDKDDDESKPDDEPQPSPSPHPDQSEDGVDKSTTSVSRAWSRDDSALDGDGDDQEADQEKENGDKEDGEKEKGKDEEELEKPTEPKPDRKSNVLLRAIDHELPVRISAHRSADILNALALAEEFNLDIILEGATEARFVADQLSEAGVLVILGQTVRSGHHVDNEFRRHVHDTGDALSEAGVRWTVSSGGQSPQAARFVGVNAQLAAAHNRYTSDWLRLVTTDAAEILGLSRGYGRLVGGGQADFVIWSGDPGDPASKVEQVYVAGKLAYEAKNADATAGGGR